MGDASVIDQFGGMASRRQRLLPGQMIIPTKRRNLNYMNNNLGNLEKPIFLHKGESRVNNTHNPLNGTKLGNVVKKANVHGNNNNIFL